jgi:hypothetical protein
MWKKFRIFTCMKNIEKKIIDLQKEWMLLKKYENDILTPTINFSSIHSPEKIEEVSNFLELEENLKVEREIYLILFNLGIEIEK